MADRGTWKINIGGADLATYADIARPRDNDGGPLIQTEAGFRATNMTHLERNNFELHLVFDLTQERATNKLATDFFLQGPQLWSGVKDVILTHKDHTGAETSYNLVAAAVRLRCSEPIGVTNISTLTISGPLVT